MDIILLERVEKLGTIGDIVTVKDGYARNFLIPQNKALRANNENKKKFEKQKAEIEKVNAELRADAEKRAKNVDDYSATIIRQASDDSRLYGSVTARDIAKALADADKEITHKSIRLNDAIKNTGIYRIQVYLHPEVSVWVKINIARTESEAEQALKGGEEAKTPEEVARDHDGDEQPQLDVAADEADAETELPAEEAKAETGDAEAEEKDASAA